MEAVNHKVPSWCCMTHRSSSGYVSFPERSRRKQRASRSMPNPCQWSHPPSMPSPQCRIIVSTLAPSHSQRPADAPQSPPSLSSPSLLWPKPPHNMGSPQSPHLFFPVFSLQYVLHVGPGCCLVSGADHPAPLQPPLAPPCPAPLSSHHTTPTHLTAVLAIPQTHADWGSWPLPLLPSPRASTPPALCCNATPWRCLASTR